MRFKHCGCRTTFIIVDTVHVSRVSVLMGENAYIQFLVKQKGEKTQLESDLAALRAWLIISKIMWRGA
jgi:hypothetical protein